MKTHPIILALLLGHSLARAQEPQPVNILEIQTAAGKGDAEARFQLARALLHGEGVKKDANKAFELMGAAADQGHPEAIGGIGYFYSVGLVVTKDETKAVECFRRAAEKGSAKAQLNLAKMLLAGKGVQGESADKLAEEGLRWMTMAADSGLPEAQLAYGSILYFGDHGVTKDPAKAALYLKPAAEHGLPDARNMIGIMAEMGQGMPMDAVAAEAWFRKAALQGNAKAQSNLGRVLGPLNENRDTRIEAMSWLLIAAGQAEVTASKLIEESLPGLKDGEFEAAKPKAAELRKSIRKP